MFFLGEIENDKINKIQGALDKISMQPFKICINSLGRFKRESGDIWWMGIKHSFNLIKMQNDLLINLKEADFDIPVNKFSPHITIARQASLYKDFNKDIFNHNFGNVYSDIYKISLMESVKTSEKLIYTEIYSKELSNLNLNNKSIYCGQLTQW